MSDKRIVEDKAVAKAAVKEVTLVVEEQAVEEEVSTKTGEPRFNESERIPSTWNFDPESDEDTIIAMNGQTQRQFNGPRKLFNELLRGGK